jgi:dTDP-D-glucose 4,6-dehydratase
VADLEPTARDLGWRPQVELALGLRRTIDCYLEYGASPGRGESP